MVIFIALPLHSLLRKSSEGSEKISRRSLTKLVEKLGKKKSERIRYRIDLR